MDDAMDLDVFNLDSLQRPLPSPLTVSPYRLQDSPDLPIGTEWCSLDALWPDGEEPDAEEHAGESWKRKTETAERRLIKRNARIDKEWALGLNELGEGSDEDEVEDTNPYIDQAAEESMENIEPEQGYASAFQRVLLPVQTSTAMIKKRPAKRGAQNPYDMASVKKQKKVTFQASPPTFSEQTGERLIPVFQQLSQPFRPIRPHPHSLTHNPGLKNAFFELRQAQKLKQENEKQVFSQAIDIDVQPPPPKVVEPCNYATAFDRMKIAAVTEKKWNPTQVRRDKELQEKKARTVEQKAAQAQLALENQAEEIERNGYYIDKKTGAHRSWYSHEYYR
tara:strand:- start:14164 stop:15168 length:1005 start_codon:yes stop_codon:yes gene_type:complete